MPDLRDYNLANASEKLEIERLAGLFDKGQANIPSTAVGMNNYYKTVSSTHLVPDNLSCFEDSRKVLILHANRRVGLVVL